MEFKRRTIEALAEMICGDIGGDRPVFVYRSSYRLSAFFEDCGTQHRHDGSTRRFWVADVLRKLLAHPQQSPNAPPQEFCRAIQVLMEKEDALNEPDERPEAMRILNAELKREGFEAFYADDEKCYLRHIASNETTTGLANPHRPFSPAELETRQLLSLYLDKASEDQFIEEVLLPLFRQLGFHRITVAGHKDKALEYGKDIWMRYTLPTQHMLYFGLQAKKGKIDAAGVSKTGNANVAELYNQILMMLGHEIFDPEFGRNVLVDHGFIVTGGEITKAARNWLGEKLDASKRSQIIFMDRNDILDLYTVTNLPLPSAAMPRKASPFIDDDIPF